MTPLDLILSILNPLNYGDTVFQVLAGMYPIAQVREPYSVVQYIAERCDLPASLGVRLNEDEDAWSAYLICDGKFESNAQEK